MGIDLLPLVAGVAIHLGADGVRNRAWYSILRYACPDAALRLRDVQAAAFAGGGVNAVVPARAGDALKVALLRRRAPQAPVATLVATLVTDSVPEFVAAIVLLAWAVSRGLVPLDALVDHPLRAAAVALPAMALAVAACLFARRRLPRVAAGLAVLGSPRILLTGVVSWQLLARAVRLVAIACCLSACGLPASAEAALLAMAVEGATRVRIAPLAATLRFAALAYGLPALTGQAAPAEAIVAYLALVGAARSGAGLAVAAGVLAHELRTCAPRRLLSAARHLSRTGAAAAARDRTARAVTALSPRSASAVAPWGDGVPMVGVHHGRPPPPASSLSER